MAQARAHITRFIRQAEHYSKLSLKYGTAGIRGSLSNPTRPSPNELVGAISVTDR